jgi:hypothetical protein
LYVNRLGATGTPCLFPILAAESEGRTMARFACLTLLLAVGGCSFVRVVVNGHGELAFPVRDAIVVSKPEADPRREYRLRLGDPYVCQPLILEWDADGRWLAFTFARYRDGPDAGGLGVLDTATGASQTLLRLSEPRKVYLFAWSPGGDCLAVLRDGRLYTIELDDRRRERSQRILTEGCVGFAWTAPDRLAVAVRKGKEHGDLAVLGRDGRTRELLTRGRMKDSELVFLEVRGPYLFAGPFVPDSLPNAGAIRIHLVEGRMRPLFALEREVMWFTVSPSGRRVAFLREDAMETQMRVRDVDAASEEGEVLSSSHSNLGSPAQLLPFWIGDDRIGYSHGDRHILLDLPTRRALPLDHLLHDIRELESEESRTGLGPHTTAATVLERLSPLLPRDLPRPLPTAVGFQAADVERFGSEEAEELTKAFMRRMRDTPALWIPYRPERPKDGKLPFRHVLWLRPRPEEGKRGLICQLMDLDRLDRPVATVEVDLP